MKLLVFRVLKRSLYPSLFFRERAKREGGKKRNENYFVRFPAMQDLCEAVLRRDKAVAATLSITFFLFLLLNWLLNCKNKHLMPG